jgi:D-alanyl-D-alanine carboxypeptidase
MALNSRPDEDQLGALATQVHETLIAHGALGPASGGAGG